MEEDDMFMPLSQAVEPDNVLEPLVDSDPGKFFNDPIHNHFRLPSMFMKFIDTVPFQRLRALKQLGLSYLVFPGASHNRFEHSLGTSNLALTWARQFYKSRQRTSLGLTQSDVLCTGLAGLCHDLGHGPLSHVFDREFLRAVDITDWSHEDMSCQMIDHIVNTRHIDISKEEVDLIKALIDKDKRSAKVKSRQDPKAWLYDIVANDSNSIDVDKFDYLQRDALHCHVSISCDFQRLQAFSMVKENKICFKTSEATTVWNLFHSRQDMHRRVYTHRKAKALEFMAVEAMVLANEALKLTDRIQSAEKFLALDDTLFDQILHYGTLFPCLSEEGGADGKLRDAKAIVTRIRERDMYRFVNEVVVPPEMITSTSHHWKAPVPQDIINLIEPSSGDLMADDIILFENKIDFTMKEGNPMDRTWFFENLRDFESKPFTVKTKHFTSMMPMAFQEVCVRLYSKRSDPEVIAKLNKAFSRWIEKRFKGQTAMATPCKGERPDDGGPAARANGGDHLPPKCRLSNNKRARGLDYEEEEERPSPDV